MRMLVGIVVLAAAFTLGNTAVERWTGSSVVQAQGSSACIQNCVNVRRWPESQCRQYCRGKPKK